MKHLLICLTLLATTNLSFAMGGKVHHEEPTLGHVKCAWKGVVGEEVPEVCYGYSFPEEEIEKAKQSAFDRCFHELDQAEDDGCYQIIRCRSGRVGCLKRHSP